MLVAVRGGALFAREECVSYATGLHACVQACLHPAALHAHQHVSHTMSHTLHAGRAEAEWVAVAARSFDMRCKCMGACMLRLPCRSGRATHDRSKRPKLAVWQSARYLELATR